MEVVITHIAICDDEENTRFYIRKLIEKQGEECRITEYASGEELLRQAGETKEFDIDLLFLDIAMGDTDGMDVARRLREMQAEKELAAWGSLPLIIFVTGYSDYMPEAFCVNAFQFVVKPIRESDFERAFTQAVCEYRRLVKQTTKKAKVVTIKNGANSQMVKADDIIYVESMGHKVMLYLRDGRMEYYGKISDLEQELEPEFFRIHKGYLVSLKAIARYDRTKVYLKNGSEVSISKYKYPDFIKAYMQYISEENPLEEG